MNWQIRDDLPIYAQLVEQIKQGIVSGAYVPGERLISVRDMASEAGVNPNTMQRALQELEREGLVFSQRTAGRFVTEDIAVIQNTKKALAERQLKTFLDAMEKLGYGRKESIALLSAEEERDESDSGM